MDKLLLGDGTKKLQGEGKPSGQNMEGGARKIPCILRIIFNKSLGDVEMTGGQGWRRDGCLCHHLLCISSNFEAYQWIKQDYCWNDMKIRCLSEGWSFFKIHVGFCSNDRFSEMHQSSLAPTALIYTYTIDHSIVEWHWFTQYAGRSEFRERKVCRPTWVFMLNSILIFLGWNWPLKQYR